MKHRKNYCHKQCCEHFLCHRKKIIWKETETNKFLKLLWGRFGRISGNLSFKTEGRLTQESKKANSKFKVWFLNPLEAISNTVTKLKCHFTRKVPWRITTTKYCNSQSPTITNWSNPLIKKKKNCHHKAMKRHQRFIRAFSGS